MWRDRVRILLMNKFKDRLVSGYTARDIPILFEHFDLDADGELGREVFWGIGRTCRCAAEPGVLMVVAWRGGACDHLNSGYGWIVCPQDGPTFGRVYDVLRLLEQGGPS